MRVLVASDAVAGLGPRSASDLIAGAFAEVGAQVAVVPMAASGDAMREALSELDDSRPVLAPDSLDALVACVEAAPEGAWLDLTALSVPDIDDLLLWLPTSRRPDLTALVPAGEVAQPLVGLQGSLAERGRELGHDLGATLAADDRARAWATGLGVDPEHPGTGARGGVTVALRAMGATVAAPLDVLAEGFRLAEVAAKADLLVTGCAELDFHAVGGDVVRRVAALGSAVLRPVVAVVGRSFISTRELRLSGIETAHAILTVAGGPEPTPEQLADTAARVAQTWRW